MQGSLSDAFFFSVKPVYFQTWSNRSLFAPPEHINELVPNLIPIH